MTSHLSLVVTRSGCRAGILGAALFTVAIWAAPLAHAGRTQLPAVGPRPPGEHYSSMGGYLKVYSELDEVPNGSGTVKYVHSIYRIFSKSGGQIRQVRNRDEEPDRVELPPGEYLVVADSESDGVVSVPVIIKRAQTTNVYLDGVSGRDEDINPRRAVRSPSGSVVGWPASRGK